ncbi:unnamed protein product [Trichobilharzia regenti]|nr:unnamed protein product [Trichobilharzia regenti]
MKVEFAFYKHVVNPGIYYVDPNGGHWRDGISVYCRLSGLETCVSPVTEQMPSVYMSPQSKAKHLWYSEYLMKSENAVSLLQKRILY